MDTSLLAPARHAGHPCVGTLDDEAARLAVAAARVTAAMAETRTRSTRTALGAARRAAGGVR